MVDLTEQWLLDGICSKCRKKDYCSKPCKSNKKRNENEILAFIFKRFGIAKIKDR